jgi:hypothetical protein
MQYSKLYAMIHPFINARWNSMIFTAEWLEAVVNNGIQQIHNEYNWSWLYDTITVPSWDFTLVWNKYEATILNKIKTPMSLDYLTWTWKYVPESEYNYSSLRLWKTILELTDETFVAYSKKVTVTKQKEYLFSYYRDYEYQEFILNPWLDLRIDDRFIPALYYLVLSQLDMLNAQQAEWSQASNFSKYQYEITKLKVNDLQTATSFIWWNVN